MFLLRSSSILAAVFGLIVSAHAQSIEKPVGDPLAPKPTITPAQPSLSFSSVNVDGPYIAMTFDDGPHATLTPKLLDLLASRHIRVTFFVVGENAARYPEILKRAVREGHEIGNHSWSHPNFGKMSDDAVRQELQKTDDAIFNAIGVHPSLMRPPYGSITARQKRWIYDSFHYKTILWDVDPNDWKRPGPAIVRQRIVKDTHAGSIILSHDIHPGTIEAMPSTFEELQAKGFKFVTVSELIARAKPATPKPIAEPPAIRPAAPAATSVPPAAPSPVGSPPIE